MSKKSSEKPAPRSGFDALPDTLDFRDRMYSPSLVDVPLRIPVEAFKELAVPILDQGEESSCTGFGLATVAHYLLRRRKVDPDPTTVSPRMLYEMAKRYDEWSGTDYGGSSARGAMKGWHKHGVCALDLWPYRPGKEDRVLSRTRAADALRRPLGAYFRVNTRDLVAMHSALAEVGALYATARVHKGWRKVKRDGIIPYPEKLIGSHAFAIVGYDEYGFWIQNSKGPGWGLGGFGHLSYEDWLANGQDVWVARLGVPISLRAPAVSVQVRAGALSHEGQTLYALRAHIIGLDGSGKPRGTGPYATSAAEIASTLGEDLAERTKDWQTRRVLLYAPSGLADERTQVQRIADYTTPLLEAEIYPVAFLWMSGLAATLRALLETALGGRSPESDGFGENRDLMLDRLDDTLEPIVRRLDGKATWTRARRAAEGASLDPDGGARIAAAQLALLAEHHGNVELHVVGHSLGAILAARLVQLLTRSGALPKPFEKGKGLGLKVKTLTLWSPACTVELFKEACLPAVKSGDVGKLALFTLTDEAEQNDNCANIYNKSLLYLASHALEAQPRIPRHREGVPILGLTKCLGEDPVLGPLVSRRKIDRVASPNTGQDGPLFHATAQHHDDFEVDAPTLRATIGRILGTDRVAMPELGVKSLAATTWRSVPETLKR